MIGLRGADVHLGTAAHLRCRGTGRKERITPLTRTTLAVLRVWLAERAGQPLDPLFPTATGTPLSRDAAEHRLSKYAACAEAACHSLLTKRVSPHVLRHTAAMRQLVAGVDMSVIALWLGHEHVDTTQIYLHADLALKERALARTTPPDGRPGRYRPSDSLLAFLDGL
ncbi:MAG: tyrosine-type recombinase/integrase [Chloroflexota bacterium]|nr:tyrosine-type recombinase/integrase [Chloroflexota bacterium]